MGRPIERALGDVLFPFVNTDYRVASTPIRSGLVKKKSLSERVVAKVALNPDSHAITLQLNCDDAIMSATLLNVVKRGVLSPHMPRTLDR